MNIFVIDHEPRDRALASFDCHLHWLAKECAQLLSNARIQAGMSAPYKLAQPHHPLSVWVRDIPGAYVFAYNHGMALLDEYAARKGYRSQRMDDVFAALRPLDESTATPDHFIVCRLGHEPTRCSFDIAVSLYRDYYREKLDNGIRGATWTNRPRPEWI